MKKTHIIGIVMMIAAVILLISVSGDMGTYSSFSEAVDTSRKVKIVGELSKDKEMYYNPEEDPNYFSFYMKDINGVEKKVILLSAKPQDFERSEQIVVTGKMKKSDFVASDILLKCPSKYKEEELFIRSET